MPNRHPWIAAVLLGLAACVPAARSADVAPSDAPTPATETEDPNTRWQALRVRADAIAWTDETRERFVAALPKIETHLHLDGSLSPKTIAALARQQGYAPLMGRSEAEIAALTVVDEPREDLAAVLEAFLAIYPLLHTPEALETVAYDFIAAAHEQNIRYVEVRFAPVLQAVPEQEFTIEAVLEAVLAGLERGRRDFAVESAVIVCLFRPLPVEVNAAMLDAAIAFRDRGVVGIDLAGDEGQVPLAEFAELYRRAADAGLFRTVHAGEIAGSKDLALALELGVDRIGHAKYIEAEPALFEEVLRRGIGLEVNLTSNHRTGAIATLAEHPARRWFDAGAALSVSTDDPGVFGITLTGEYSLLIRELGFGVGDLIELQRRTIATLFMPEADKRHLEARMLAEIEALLDAL
jgi:adenosine deaminase